jgi:hypothetical protein
MRSVRSWCFGLLVAFSLVGCGGAGDGGSSGGGGPTTLFTDDFSGPLGAKWIEVSGTNGARATSGDPDTLGSPPHGNPSPGLWMQGDSFGTSPGFGGAVRSAASFPSASVTFSADVRYDSGLQSFAGNYLAFALYNLNTNGVKAGAFVLPTSVRYLLFQGTTSREVTQPAPADGAFHRFTLSIDAAGNAAWYRDGVLQQSVPGFPSLTLYVKVTGPSATDTVPGTGHADNVLVTTP